MGWLPGALSWGQISKSPRLPEVCIHLLATPFPLEVAWTSSSLMQKAVERAQAGYIPLTLPQGSSSVGRGDQVRWTELMGPLVWGTVVWQSMRRIWPLFQSYTILCQSPQL